MPLIDEGHMIEPPVSVPMVRAARLAEAAVPEPELDPQGLRSRAYGFRHWPPRALQPLDAFMPAPVGPLAHVGLGQQDRAGLAQLAARRTSPAGGTDPSSASEPAVVVIRSCVSMLSLSATGMPCSGPRTLPALRSASSWSAMASASGLVSMIARSSGPLAVQRLDARQIQLGDGAAR